jgi:hypothetical protein
MNLRLLEISENPKDPGIPNNFPFKDQVLAEIAEERRKVRAYIFHISPSLLRV